MKVMNEAELEEIIQRATQRKKAIEDFEREVREISERKRNNRGVKNGKK